MTENWRDRALRQRRRVNADDESELRYWLTILGVTEDELRRAVHAVGVEAEDVRGYLVGKYFA